MPKQKDFFEKVAETLIERLKQGTAPWQRSWDGGAFGAMPMNPTTGKRYKGGNALFLMAQGYDDPRWMTYKQAEKEGAQVNRGEHGTPIIYWKFQEEQKVLDEHGKPVVDEQGKTKTRTVELERPRGFLSYVFNAQQIDGLQPLIENTEQQWFAEARAEAILKNSNARIEHRQQGRAFYRPRSDSITLPLKEQFSSAVGYYSTALHELGHWTGHESRLNRDLVHPFGSEGYAREELRAEIASLMVGMEMGVYTPDVDNHAAYVASWIKALEEDPREIFRAAADAEKILDYVMAFELRQEQKAVLSETVTNDIENDKKDYNSPSHSAVEQQHARIYLNVPYIEKNEAKALGAKWDRGQGAWYIPQGMDAEPFNRWSTVTQETDSRVAALGHEVGVSAMPHAHQQLMQSEEWANAKSGDKEAAEKIISIFWSEEKTEELRKKLLPDVPIVFVTVPSSTDKNQVPMALARTLATGLGGEVVDGGALFDAIDGTPMKRIPKGERVFSGRNYIPASQSFHILEKKQIVLVEDVLTTGSSAYAVVRALQQRKVSVQTVAGLMGDARLTPEPQLVRAFQKALKQVGVTTQSKDIARVLSRGEIKSIIETINTTHGKEETHELAQRIQGIFHKRTHQLMGSDTQRAGRRNGTGKNGGHEETVAGVQAISADMGDRGRQEKSRATADGTRTVVREYLNVPYLERRAAKEAGAKWDAVARSWYAGDDADMQKLAQWLPDRQHEQAPAMPPREEFAEALRGLNCKVQGEHPIMDGKTHRIATEGDVQGAQSGFYVGYMDGHPAGYAKNNRSGEEIRWKSQGVFLSAEQQKHLAAQCIAKRVEHAHALVTTHEQTALRIQHQLGEMEAVTEQTPYMVAKRISPQEGAFVTKDGKTTCLPAQDAEGKVWTMQYIQEDGTKRFAKNGRKEGCFHCIGGSSAVAKAPVLVICEGYATASTLASSLGHGVVAAFDAGNLASVAKVLHEKYPGKAIVIAGDDDRHLIDSPIRKNPGREKAQEAAALVGGVAVFPTFAPEERGRDFKDFNDLGTKSSLGQAAIVRQIRPAIEKAQNLRRIAFEQARAPQQGNKNSR